jgi:ABC-type branched-subunit amino acid transport system ATPase component
VPEPLLRVDHLTGGYGPSQVLFGISFIVPEQGAVAVLGRNGAGKTTLLRTLLGYLRPTGGSVNLGETTSPAWRRRNWFEMGSAICRRSSSCFQR